MAVIGIGIDVVDVARFGETLERTPAIRDRLFTEQERARPVASLAARFAAKEALAKALGAPTGMAWLDAEVVNESSGDPQLEIRGSVLARANDLGRGPSTSRSPTTPGSPRPWSSSRTDAPGRACHASLCGGLGRTTPGARVAACGARTRWSRCERPRRS